MKNPKFSLLWLVLFCGALRSAAQPALINKVEPPNWWVGMQWSDLQLMIYGDHLDGITARFTDERLQVRAVHTLPNPHYAFVDISIPADVPPGEYALVLSRNGQETSTSFSILDRAPADGRHQGFSDQDVVYLITPDRFANGDPRNDQLSSLGDFDPDDPGKRHGGDLQGIIGQLDFLAGLGVTALWLNPVLENNGRYSYHGYAATDLYRIDPRLGANADYRRLVQEAHQRGLKVIFDHVNNHIGVNHPWLSDLPMTDWINGSQARHSTDKHYLLSITDPYAAPNTVALQKTFWFVDDMPDLNQRNAFLANYLIQNTLWWMEYTGLDGIREDTYPYPDQDFLARWAEAILREYPQSNIVGEIWALQPAYIAQFQTRSYLARNFETNLPTVMDFPLCEAIRAYIRGQGRLQGVYDVLAQDFLYTDPSRLLTFVDNHDMTRAIYEAQGNTGRVKQALTMLLTTRGIPQLLYGTEINMRGGAGHVELRADFPGGFPGHTRNAFTEAGRTPEENEVFNYLRQLLQLRQQHAALRGGRLIHYPMNWNNNIYKYLRLQDDEKILVLINGEAGPAKADLTELEPLLGRTPELTNLMNGQHVRADLQEGIMMEQNGALIFLVNDK